MELIELIGYSCALFIGLILGLIGGGGSILTVPVLVYVLSINPITATAYSLFVVGSSAMVGAYKNVQKRLVNYKLAIYFGIPSLIGVSITRRFIVPELPEYIFSFTKDDAIMLFFAFVMALSAISMITRKEKNCDTVERKPYNFPLIITEGLTVGALTGLVGAGGGFLIIPALVLLAGLPIKEAIGTSLFIIAIKSMVGFFVGDVFTMSIDWIFLLPFTALSIIGILVGVSLSKHISGDRLKRGFGYFLVVMTLCIIYKTFFC